MGNCEARHNLGNQLACSRPRVWSSLVSDSVPFRPDPPQLSKIRLAASYVEGYNVIFYSSKKRIVVN